MAEALASALLALPPRLVLFDGVCGFCDGAVRWLLARDAAGRLSFASLQGETAAWLRSQHPEIPTELETMIFVDSTQERRRIYLRFEAATRVCAELTGPWRWLAALRWLPRPLTAWLYRGFARNRYRVFGKLEACRVPDASERRRFVP